MADERKRRRWPWVVAELSVRRIATVFLWSAVAISASGCDPGYRYGPFDAKSGRVFARTEETIDNIRFLIEGYSILIGEESIGAGLTVANDTDKSVFLAGANILTNGRTIGAPVDDSGDGRQARTVAPHRKESVYFSVPLGGPGHEILGKEVTWTWRLRIGEDEHTLQVPMKRDR